MFEFDEHFYINKYPDVAEDLKSGKLTSAREHYEQHGRAAGRSGHAIADDSPRTFVAGAYGTRNVGDEAIYEGVAQEFSNAVQLYINLPRILNAVEVFSMTRGENKFRPCDRLIIGGGGLLYDAGAINLFIELCKRAKEAGSEVSILGIGSEAAVEGFFPAIRELYSYADHCSVRSLISQEIIKKITGRAANIREDFAFNLKPQMPALTKSHPLKIGIITGGDVRKDYDSLIQIIRRYSSNKQKVPIKFVHIPHSESYISIYNCDRIVGLKLHAGVHCFLEGRRSNFSLLHFCEDPQQIFDVYAGLSGVISERFHGLVFSHLFGLPALAMSSENLKTKSFVDTHRRPTLVLSKGDADLNSKFEELLEIIRQPKLDSVA